ncbi:MAG TPA: hypothetical protein VFZ09_05555 [Archangium sp.]|uniref:hypothetical protein n=1 Tax=Archangium sp. TaxID=1872627 RepID=UPI002E30A203|nr:hypothetical protein [Archangium sp.]HEX5745687.1 hypothetical protein [Archangium sp.]
MRHALALLAVALLATGCPKKTGENQPADNPSANDAGPQTGSTGATLTAPTNAGPKGQGDTQATTEACVDRWLQEHKLDRYGNAEGTMYAGGTPLFNEATGESRDRLEYVFARQPEARKACATPSAQ